MAGSDPPLTRTHFWSGDGSTDQDDSFSVDSAQPVPTPSRIGRYVVQGTLGRGGFGVVYLAVDEQLGRQVAVKVPHRRVVDRAEVTRLGEGLGLSKDWAYRVVKHVGNYGESYERNLGSRSPLAIPRGLNRLWSQGGLQYAPPVR